MICLTYKFNYYVNRYFPCLSMILPVSSSSLKFKRLITVKLLIYFSVYNSYQGQHLLKSLDLISNAVLLLYKKNRLLGYCSVVMLKNK